ncbi:ISWI chromatin remodeling complex ATPase ISW2, putative [Perkinsus marinus ATCC 50983]|uniref:ISWI chromatin remodeling complex ATPase ISW2, putative n=1 Tax=Perkinsus marinus (strain ATCC 50983 / TXsc) TaxID=423536 RepID=C5KD07_PERM5|nr:ISWI chromatin remodeling complex ATPase ISW2, putative [Perkinsus marinus ATCC 50983]EER17756.1 ISWI chromatin remodeling complex ATPase ISW2, putative [Perkinsus marinus ATCC 50983]|eukprot:XP_002785960.1 ISWI chromatin remodeling complex ATPase ISW2, putative [Perkinsus marinus ATCC 50983]
MSNPNSSDTNTDDDAVDLLSPLMGISAIDWNLQDKVIKARRLPSGRADAGDACRLWLQSKPDLRIPCWYEACSLVEEDLSSGDLTASLAALHHWRRDLVLAAACRAFRTPENRSQYIKWIPSKAEELRSLWKLTEKIQFPRETRQTVAERVYKSVVIPAVVKHGDDLRQRWQWERHLMTQLAVQCKQATALIRKAQEEWERKQEAKRMKLLRENNYAEYVKMIKESKNKKLVELLEQTDSFLSELGDKVRDDQEKEGCRVTGVVDYHDALHQLREDTVVQPANLSNGCNLLPHQLQGLRWLRSLKLNKLNGILADEMGLGKTIQVIALIASLMRDDPTKEDLSDLNRYLIVVPLSTLPNWIAEFKKWLPSARVVVLRGDLTTRRQIARVLHSRGVAPDVNYDVCLTTPEILIRETKTLSKVHWTYVIIDEGHKIKNHLSRFHMAVSSVPARHRLLLTGTPLQNSLTELWALLKFLLPKVFTDADKFAEWFSKPFEGHAASALTQEEQLLVLHKLHTMLQPFLLRRTKSQATLPKKIEHLVWVPLSAWQDRGMHQIMQRALCGGHGEQKVALRNVLMQLRKMAQHPYLFLDEYDINDDLVRVSGKFELLDRLVPKLLHFNHKVLIFSQMTCLLDILEQFLENKGLQWFRLDGSTSLEDRQSAMHRFNDPLNHDTNIFLLSTRAGGLGLNLQAANTVILYDSDWNPQMDLQAMDRAHRVGQKSDVIVLRLTGMCPIERLILQKATTKRNIDKKVIQGGHYIGEANTDLSDDSCVRLKSLLELAEFEEQLSCATSPTDLNNMLARTPEELAWFEAFDARLEAHDTRLMQLHEIPEWLKDDPLAHDDAETVLLDRATRRENCAVRNYADDGLSEASWTSE